MKKIKNILISFLFLIAISVTAITNVKAETYKINISGASTAEPGSTITLTISIVGCRGGTVNLTGNNCTLSKSTIMIDGSETVKVKVGNSGTAKISATCSDATPKDSFDLVEAKGSKNITIKSKTTNNNSGTGSSNNNNNSTTNNTGSTSNNNEPVEDTRSKENSLSSLKVSEGTLSPAFNSGTTDYKVEVGNTVNKITLSATAKDSKASITGTGEKTLKVGDNSFQIKCTAENGSVKTYKINVHVDETPLVYTEYNDKKLGVVRTDVVAPEGFEETTITLENEQVTAFHNNQLDKTVIYLIDENNNKNYYLFEEDKGITSIFIPTALLGRNVYIIDVNENDLDKKGMLFGDVTVDGNTLKGWTYEDPTYANYELIIVMNEHGEKVIYQHEKTENSLQLYTAPQETNSNPEIVYILAGTTGLFALTTLFFVIKYLYFKKKKIKEIKTFYEKRTPQNEQPK